MTPPLLAAYGLGVTIAGNQVCSGLDLAILPGQCWAILGRNGAGKTTLLHTLAGLRGPAAGTIELRGKPLATLARRDIARLRGLLLQDDSDAFPATVLESVLVGRHPHLSRWQWESAEDVRIAREALAAADMAVDLSHQLALLERLAAAVRLGDKALIMVVHDVNLAVRYCDHALLLADGEALAGPAQELFTAERLSAVYRVSLKEVAGPRGNLFAPD
ncbi:MAG: ABC transporter ATP-binding protein [Betaproteobacteria bacterium]|nr:MAG: ABC transporter ATP-binding protein [Betaproteobacteria bacterium]